MKKVLALVIALVLLATMAPLAFAASTVNVSVSVDGKLVVAAQPVSITDMTVNGALKAAHTAYFKDGVKGYKADTDNSYKMFLITKFWGVATTPYVIVNDTPVGSDSAKPTADLVAVKAGDNIVVSLSSSTSTPAIALGLKAATSGDSATITANQWSLDFSTFKYTSAPYAKGAVVDSAGKALGTTDAKGSATVAIPSDGIICIKGLAAIKVAAPAATTPTPSAPKYTVVLSSQAVKVDGVAKSLEVYNIDGSNYFKLRDLAFVLNGTKSQFSVDFDQAKQAISCAKGAAYVSNGSELVIGADKSSTAVPSAQSLIIDGKAASLSAYNIGGNNFFKLRDAGTALGFTVDYDDASKTMLITSAK